ncbi:hypothetical protein DIU36_24735 [Mucilaginibacter rubeus]|nr:hypothetical protein DIU36_24735 [Mucilaginibacter rubeus]
MKNKDNKIVVNYPNVGLRVRNCQTTVRPTEKELGPITDFNTWQMHLRFATDTLYNATFAADAIIATESLLCDANEIIYTPAR